MNNSKRKSISIGAILCLILVILSMNGCGALRRSHRWPKPPPLPPVPKYHSKPPVYVYPSKIENFDRVPINVEVSYPRINSGNNFPAEFMQNRYLNNYSNHQRFMSSSAPHTNNIFWNSHPYTPNQSNTVAALQIRPVKEDAATYGERSNILGERPNILGSHAIFPPTPPPFSAPPQTTTALSAQHFQEDDNRGPIRTIPAPKLNPVDKPPYFDEMIAKGGTVLDNSPLRQQPSYNVEIIPTVHNGHSTNSFSDLNRYQLPPRQPVIVAAHATEPLDDGYFAPDPDPSVPSLKVPPTTDPYSIPSEVHKPRIPKPVPQSPYHHYNQNHFPQSHINDQYLGQKESVPSQDEVGLIQFEQLLEQQQKQQQHPQRPSFAASSSASSDVLTAQELFTLLNGLNVRGGNVDHSQQLFAPQQQSTDHLYIKDSADSSHHDQQWQLQQGHQLPAEYNHDRVSHVDLNPPRRNAYDEQQFVIEDRVSGDEERHKDGIRHRLNKYDITLGKERDSNSRWSPEVKVVSLNENKSADATFNFWQPEPNKNNYRPSFPSSFQRPQESDVGVAGNSSEGDHSGPEEDNKEVDRKGEALHKNDFSKEWSKGNEQEGGKGNKEREQEENDIEEENKKSGIKDDTSVWLADAEQMTDRKEEEYGTKEESHPAIAVKNISNLMAAGFSNNKRLPEEDNNGRFSNHRYEPKYDVDNEGAVKLDLKDAEKVKNNSSENSTPNVSSGEKSSTASNSNATSYNFNSPIFDDPWSEDYLAGVVDIDVKKNDDAEITGENKKDADVTNVKKNDADVTYVKKNDADITNKKPISTESKDADDNSAEEISDRVEYHPSWLPEGSGRTFTP